MENRLTRREFATAAGLSPLLLSMQDPEIGEDYLARGLHALSVAHKFRWNAGHHGAAVVAGYFFSRENGLDGKTQRLVRKNLDGYLRRRKKFFPAPVKSSKRAKVDVIAETLADGCSELRSGGHDTIYAAIALKALKQLPDRATPEVVDGVCSLIRDTVKNLGAAENTEHNQKNPMPAYKGKKDIALATADAMLRPMAHFVDGTRTSHGNVIHWVTQGEAIMTLHDLGYDEVAKKAHKAHQLYINHPFEKKDPVEAKKEKAEWLKPEFWESDEPRDFQKGSWLFGHSFKFPYSLFVILKQIEDADHRTRCAVRSMVLARKFS